MWKSALAVVAMVLFGSYSTENEAPDQHTSRLTDEWRVALHDNVGALEKAIVSLKKAKALRSVVGVCESLHAIDLSAFDNLVDSTDTAIDATQRLLGAIQRKGGDESSVLRLEEFLVELGEERDAYSDLDEAVRSMSGLSCPGQEKT